MTTLEYLQLTINDKTRMKHYYCEEIISSWFGVFIYGNINDGILRSWWHNNQLASQIYFKNNKVDGELKTWKSDGRIVSYELFKEGILIKKLK